MESISHTFDTPDTECIGQFPSFNTFQEQVAVVVAALLELIPVAEPEQVVLAQRCFALDQYGPESRSADFSPDLPVL